MRLMHNNKGIVLVTAVMITLLSLVIIMGILYVVTQGIKTGASTKIYRNAVDASYGGANVAMYEVLPELAKAILATDPTVTGTNTATAALATSFSFINLQFASNAACLNQKLQFDPSTWTSAICPGLPASVKAKDIKSNPDMTFRLQGTSGATFTVYSKIVDTIPGTPYMGGADGGLMVGGGVTDTAASGTPTGRHYVYRIEVIGEKTANALEQGNLTVMYEY